MSMNPSGQPDQNDNDATPSATTPSAPTPVFGSMTAEALSRAKASFTAQQLGNALQQTNQTAAEILSGHQSTIVPTNVTPTSNIYSSPSLYASNAPSPISAAPAVTSSTPIPPISAPVTSSAPTNNMSYLDQISTASSKSHFFSKKMLVILGVAGLALIIAIIIIVVSGSRVKNASGAVLAQRILNLQKLIDYGDQNQLSSSDLTNVSAELNLVLLSSTNDLSKVYGAENFTQPDKELTAEYSDASTIAELDKAKASANLDTAFRDTLSNSIDDTESYINTLYQESKNQATRTTLATTYANLAELKSRLSESD